MDETGTCTILFVLGQCNINSKSQTNKNGTGAFFNNAVPKIVQMGLSRSSYNTPVNAFTIKFIS